MPQEAEADMSSSCARTSLSLRGASFALFALLLPTASFSFSLAPSLSGHLATRPSLSTNSALAFSSSFCALSKSRPLRSARTLSTHLNLAAKIAPPKKLEFLERKKLQESITRLEPVLHQLREQEFFRYYAVDLLSSCTFFPTADAPCDVDRCEIEGTEDVPDNMRERDEREHTFSLDGWVRWDMPGDFTEYYDLIEEPERYTEYDGSRVWNFIHQKICFQTDVDLEENEWKKDFNKAISGLHTSVSAHVVETMGLEEEAMVAEYKRRIRDIPDALENLVYAYYLQLCAIHKSQSRLSGCDYMGQKAAVQPLIKSVLEDAFLSEQCVENAERAMREHAMSSGALVWKARLRTRDLLGIMNCVQCNVCRLHGKVVALGVAVALSIILGMDGEGGDVERLHRIEVAALITTAGKFASAIKFCTEMERKLQAGV